MVQLSELFWWLLKYVACDKRVGVFLTPNINHLINLYTGWLIYDLDQFKFLESYTDGLMDRVKELSQLM